MRRGIGTKIVFSIVLVGLWLLGYMPANSAPPGPANDGAIQQQENGAAGSRGRKRAAALAAAAQAEAQSTEAEPGQQPAPDAAGRAAGRAAPAAAQGSEVQEEVEAGERYVTIDFDNVDINLFIKYISELTGTNFVVDKSVKGNITIISPTKISVEEAYKVFESVLEVQGYTTVPAGSINKIVPAVQARSKSVSTGLDDISVDTTDNVVTQLIPLKYASPDEMKKIFAPLVSKNSVVISYDPTGMLIVTDVLSNIRRLVSIINEIDVPSVGEEVSVITLVHGSATEVAKSLTAVFQVPKGKAGKARPAAAAAPPGEAGGGAVVSGDLIKILPDTRTNSLIVLASVDDTTRIRQLINLLDREIPRGEGDIHVYYLQNAKAEDLATVLTSLPGKADAKGPEQGKAPVLSKDVNIVADKATNSLVITAKKADYIVLEDVLAKLDIPRRMVYLEALIMEVKVDKEFNLGVEWRGGLTFDGGKGAYFASRPATTSSIPNATTGIPSSQGLSLGVLGKAITISGISYPSIAAVVEAFASDSDVHIVSRPQILTTDNEEAEIKVGENVPYITSQNQNTSGQDYTNYEYKDVGVNLKITPQINQEGVVRMKLYTEVIKLKDPNSSSTTPTTLKRTADTTVIVKDQNTVVIGGIIGDDIKDTITKVPLLGDIPILGWAFKRKSYSTERTNLYIFLTPRIIRNPADAQTIYDEKKADADIHQTRGFIKKTEDAGDGKEAEEAEKK